MKLYDNYYWFQPWYICLYRWFRWRPYFFLLGLWYSFKFNEWENMDICRGLYDEKTLRLIPLWGKEADELQKVYTAIRYHRDQRGDDRCWKDNEELWAILPEGYTPPKRDSSVELANCEKYIESCHNPNIYYVSPQRAIDSLEKISEIAYKLCVSQPRQESTLKDLLLAEILKYRKNK